LVTNDARINTMIKKIKANGRMCECAVCTRAKGYCPLSHYENDPRFMHDYIGYNFKTMEFQAALGVLQLDKFHQIMARRQEIVRYYNQHLAQFGDILSLPLYSDDISYLAYPLIVKKDAPIDRARLRQRLSEKGVESRPLFGCIPNRQLAYLEYSFTYENMLPNADFLGDNGFYIGCHQYLTDADLEHVIASFKKVLSQVSAPTVVPVSSNENENENENATATANAELQREAV